ncbi:MAG: TonB family protein, partial [Bacteroidales bacterium]|nr:TonB family protein [Bacteroidales bacterium]
ANFSFFNYAFVNKKNRNSESYSAIIKHEFVHIVQKHSVDIILAEIVTIVLWFNPFAWLYKKSIKENHEYIADAEVINNSLSVIEYQKILFEQSFGVNFSIANSFNSSLTFKRLNMMKKIKSNKYMKYRVLITLPAILLMIVFVSFSNENNSTIIKNVNPLSVNQDIDLSENLSLIDDTFFIVEKMPEFPGGEFGLRKFIATNIKYPESARDNGIAGKVFIRFAVTKDGSVDNVHVARSVDQLLDEEAIRVVKLLKGWKPGEQKGEKVNVWFIVPINFALK